MTRLEFLANLNDVPDAYLESALDLLRRKPEKAKRLARRRIVTFALAAALILGLGAAAYAIAAGLMKSRAVKGEAVTGTWNGQYIAYPEAEYELAFEFYNNRSNIAQFRADWLPGTDDPAAEWHEYLAKGEGEEVLYTVQIIQTDVLRDTKFYFNGHMTVVKQDDWRDFKRIELCGDYREYVPKGSTAMLDRNYLLLFSEEDGYLVYIASSVYDLNVLEKIADNLQFRLTEGVVLPVEREETIAVLDLGLPEGGQSGAQQHSQEPPEQAGAPLEKYESLLAFYTNKFFDGEEHFLQSGAFFFKRDYYDWLMEQPAEEPMVFIVHGIFPDMTDEDAEHNIKTAKIFEAFGLTAEVWRGQGTENGLEFAGSVCYVTMTPRRMLELSELLYDGENYFFFEEQYPSVKARMTEKQYPSK